MLVLLWTELHTISAEIGRLQKARLGAKQNADTASVSALSAELEAALSARENLVEKIGGIAGDVGELCARAASSPYLNRPTRSLSEIFEIRQKRAIRPFSNAAIQEARLSLGPMDSSTSFDIFNMTTRLPLASA